MEMWPYSALLPAGICRKPHGSLWPTERPPVPVCRDRFLSRPAAPRGYLTTLLLLRRRVKALLSNRWVCVVLAFDLSTPMGAHVACRVILAALSLWCSVLPLLL